MNPYLELHWRARERDRLEAERQMQIERRSRRIEIIRAYAYWCGIAFGATVLVCDMSKGVW